MGVTVDRNGLEVLGRGECLRLLSAAVVGRIGTSLDSTPAVLPVNFRLVDERILFETTPGTKLDAATRNAVVSFDGLFFSFGTTDLSDSRRPFISGSQRFSRCPFGRRTICRWAAPSLRARNGRRLRRRCHERDVNGGLYVWRQWSNAAGSLGRDGLHDWCCNRLGRRLRRGDGHSRDKASYRDIFVERRRCSRRRLCRRRTCSRNEQAVERLRSRNPRHLSGCEELMARPQYPLL